MAFIDLSFCALTRSSFIRVALSRIACANSFHAPSCAAVMRSWLCSVLMRVSTSSAGADWQDDAKRRPATGNALDLDRPPVALDDAVRDREAEAGPDANSLGGEARVEDARQVLRGDTTSAVGDLDDHAPEMRGAAVAV